MIVADTNVIAYLYINGERSAQAEALLSQDPDWIVPTLWLSEFRNVLSLYLRQDLMTFDRALAVLSLAEAFFKDSEYKVASTDVMELVSSSTCSAYDCEFVALAKQLGLKLVTSDKKVLKAFPNIAVSLESYA